MGFAAGGHCTWRPATGDVSVVGGADASLGSGLHGLTERVEALGGRLLVTSPAGAGTVVTAQVPCAS